jgi:hypothetical protein
MVIGQFKGKVDRVRVHELYVNVEWLTILDEEIVISSLC